MKKWCLFLVVFLLLGGCSQRPSGQAAPDADSASSLSSVSTPSSVSSERAQEQTPSPDPSSAPFSSSGSGASAQVQESASSSSAATPAQPLTKTLTIPEGYTLARIGMLLEEMEICTVQEFISVCQNEDFSDFPLLAAQPANENRCFSLEGYLFPDTYEIYSTDPPEAIVRRILTHTEQMLSDDIRRQIQQSGYSVDEILTLASIIEKEAFGHEQMPNISSVLHNRLDAGMRLQCDVTITYVEGAIKPFISGDINRYNSYYNTYKCPALPAGPICNPGMQAIQAALSPAETPYFYFVTDANKTYYYAETWEEHQANVKAAGL